MIRRNKGTEGEGEANEDNGEEVVMGVYKRNGKKGAVYWIDYYVGEKRYREAVGPNRREAEAALGKKLAEIREGRFFDRKDFPAVTVEELAKRFLEWAKVKKSVEGYRVHSRPIVEHFRGRLISTITEHDVERFRSVRKDTPTRTMTARSNSTLNHDLAMFKMMMNKAVAWGLLERNPAAKVKPLRETKGRTRFLSVEEAKNLIEAASRHLRPILICALETGMRRGKILGLRWSDVDMKNAMIYFGETKNGKARHVPMSNRLRATLAALPRRLGTDFVFTGSILKTPAGNGRNRPLNQPIGKVEPFHDVRTAFQTACTKAGIEDFRFHDLRHTAASHMIMAGVPFKTVGEILGHTTTAMTERYSHLTPEHKRKAIEMLSATFDGMEDFTGHKSVAN